MIINRSWLLLFAACICFFIALVLALGGSIVGSYQDWIAGGLLSYALAGIVPGP